MKKRNAWKRIAAWVLTAAMITGSNSFGVLAQELAEEPAQEAAVQENAGVYETAEVVESAPEEMAVQTVEEAPTGVPEEVTAEQETPAEVQEPASDGGADVLPEQEGTAGEDTEIPETAEAVEGENEALPENAGAAESGTEATPENTEEGFEDEEVIIGDEGMETEALPESVEEAIEAALLAEEAGDVWLEGMRGDGWSWIFYDEDQTLTLNTDSLEGEDFTLQWEVGQCDEDGNITEADKSAYTVNKDGSITLHGAILEELYPETDGDNPFQVRATVLVGDVEVTGTTNDIRMREPYYDYYFPATNPGERDLIPGESIWIDKWMGGYVSNKNHPEGEWLDFEVTDVKITEQGIWGDDNGNKIPLEDGEEEPVRLETEANGWRLCADRYGWAKIRMTYIDANGDEVVYGEDENDEFYVYVHGEAYRLDFAYPDDSNRLPYPGALTIESSLRLDRDGEGSQQVDDYRLMIQTDEQGNPSYNTDAIEVVVSEDGRSLVVTSKGSECQERIYVAVEVPEKSAEGGWTEVCQAYADVEVMDNYYVIRFAKMPEDGIRTQIGNTLDVSSLQPEVYACNANNPQGVLLKEDENLRVTLIRSENQENGWDENAWEVVPGTESNLIPTLKRTGTWGTGITVFLEERQLEENGDPEEDADGNEIWRENCRVDLGVPDLEYNVKFNDLRGWQEDEDYTWVFTDEDLTLELYMENILVAPEKLSVEWQIGTWNDETQTFDVIIDNENDEYFETIESNGTFSITLHGEKLAEVYKGDYTWCVVSGTVYVDSIDVWQIGTGVDVREPRYDYNFPLSGDWEDTLLPCWNRDIGNQIDCYIENKDHPWGENTSVPIENVEILGQGYDWNEDENRPEDYDISGNREEIIILDGNAEEGWSLRSNGNGFGFAHVRITYTDVQNQQTVYEFPVFVGGERYEFWYDYSDGTDFMLPNSEMEITTGLIYDYVDDYGENQSEEPDDYKLSVTWDDGEPTYDTDLLNIEVVGNTKLRINSNDNQGSTDIYVRVMRQNAETGEYDVEVIGESVHVNVSDEMVDTCEHSWDNGVVTTASTCVTAGIKTYTCAKCGAQKTEKLPLADHTWGDWKVTKEATETEEGKKERTCAVCGVVETGTIPAAGKTDPAKDAGLHLDEDGIWRYYEDGKFAESKSGIVAYSGEKFWVSRGILVKDANQFHEVDGIWYWMCQGRVVREYTGAVYYDGYWFWVTNGVKDVSVTGLKPYDGEIFLFIEGQIRTDISTLYQNSVNGDGEWYWLANGRVVDEYTGLVEYNGAWFYVKNGKLDWTYTGTTVYDGVLFKVKNGALVGAA